MDGDVRGGWEREGKVTGVRFGGWGVFVCFLIIFVKHSHEELGGRWVVTGGAGLSEAIAGKFLTLELVGISLSGEPGHFLLELFHLLNELGLFVLQVVFLLDTFIPAGLGIAPVLQGPPLLLEADHLVFGEASEVPVELPHGHGDQLVIREPVLHAAGGGMLLVRVLELLGGAGGGGGSGRGLVVMMVVVVRVPAAGQVFVSDCGVLVVVLVMVVMVVVVGPEAFKALQLLGHLVGPNEGFDGVLRGEVQRLGVHLLVAVGHPVQVLQVGLLLGGAEAGRGGHGAAGGADGGGGDGAGGLQAGAVPARAVVPAQGLLLHVELHQVEVVDVLHGQGASGQLGSDAELSGHRCLAGTSPGGGGWRPHSSAQPGRGLAALPYSQSTLALLPRFLASAPPAPPPPSPGFWGFFSPKQQSQGRAGTRGRLDVSCLFRSAFATHRRLQQLLALRHPVARRKEREQEGQKQNKTKMLPSGLRRKKKNGAKRLARAPVCVL